MFELYRQSQISPARGLLRRSCGRERRAPVVQEWSPSGHNKPLGSSGKHCLEMSSQNSPEPQSESFELRSTHAQLLGGGKLSIEVFP
jgi:hypothetical protein